MTMTLEVRDGRFAYPGEKPVLDGVNFSFSGRGILSILGPNGAGKTTLLRALLGLAPFSSGSVRWCGREWRDWKPREFWTRVGYVPQAKVPQFAAMTISELVALGRSSRLSPFALPGAADWEAVDRALETVGIAHLGERLCSAVSGGQLQLALIARALAAEPELLVLDEPESNLDFRNQRAARSQGRTAPLRTDRTRHDRRKPHPRLRHPHPHGRSRLPREDRPCRRRGRPIRGRPFD